MERPNSVEWALIGVLVLCVVIYVAQTARGVPTGDAGAFMAILAALLIIWRRRD